MIPRPRPRSVLSFLLLLRAWQVGATPECQEGFGEISRPIQILGPVNEGQRLLTVPFDACGQHTVLDTVGPGCKIRPNGDVFATTLVAPGSSMRCVVMMTTELGQNTVELSFIVLPRPSVAAQSSDLRHRRTLKESLVIYIEENKEDVGDLKELHEVAANAQLEVSKFILEVKGPNQDLFTIDESNGLIRVTRPLDREEQASYTMNVRLMDKDGMEVLAPFKIKVVVKDVNDNSPEFGETSYVDSIPEGSPAGTTVMQMTAMDRDDPNTEHAQLRYSIVQQQPKIPSDKMFHIEDSGFIVTAVSANLLDRETIPKYTLVIQATDMAGKPGGRSETATATISIGDRNDNPPIFDSTQMTVEVPEGLTGVVYNITVSDADEEQKPTWFAVFTILNTDLKNATVNTDPSTNHGMVTLLEPLDYERNSSHFLIVSLNNEEIASDILPSTATVSIRVADKNEPPVFSPKLLVVVRNESVSVKTFITKLSAKDPDTAQQQNISFAVDHDPEGWLEVDPKTGHVRTRAQLDRESPQVKNNIYTAKVIAFDTGDPPATGSGTIMLTLLDTNDNAPIVSPTHVIMCEGDTSTNPILHIKDADIPSHGPPFHFQLIQQDISTSKANPEWKLRPINDTHTRLVSNETPRRGTESLVFVISDHGSPSLTGSTTVSVTTCPCEEGRKTCSGAERVQLFGSAWILTLLASSTFFSGPGA
uniref:cadherin-13-like isoform X1 n=2 Tax=Myxine glutinosa TaxID=7769 RepID=UPI00358F828C